MSAYLYDAIRTPFGRHGGALAEERPDDLAAHVVRALLARLPDLDPARIDDVGATLIGYRDLRAAMRDG